MLLTVARMHCMRWEAWWVKAGTGTLVNCIGSHHFFGSFLNSKSETYIWFQMGQKPAS